MSNILGFETRASVEQHARAWLIRLDGDSLLDEAERQSLRAWLGQHPSHREELMRLAKFWNQANVLTELAVPLKQARVQRSPKTPLLWLAASVVVAVVLGVAWRFQSTAGAANGSYETVIGQQETLSLPDGSTIELNTDSQARVDYSPTERKIHLLRGEALFTVEHNALRPFEVYAGEARVRAVGTAFSVNVVDEKVSVIVTKGTVEVAEAGSAADVLRGDAKVQPPSARVGILKKGETMTVGGQSHRMEVTQLPESELRRRTAWRDGYLAFSGEPLSEVVVQLNRYSTVKLEIADAKLESVAVGGRFRVGDLDGVLDVLRANFGIESTRVDDRHIRLAAVASRAAH